MKYTHMECRVTFICINSQVCPLAVPVWDKALKNLVASGVVAVNMNLISLKMLSHEMIEQFYCFIWVPWPVMELKKTKPIGFFAYIQAVYYDRGGWRLNVQQAWFLKILKWWVERNHVTIWSFAVYLCFLKAAEEDSFIRTKISKYRFSQCCRHLINTELKFKNFL